MNDFVNNFVIDFVKDFVTDFVKDFVIDFVNYWFCYSSLAFNRAPSRAPDGEPLSRTRRVPEPKVPTHQQLPSPHPRGLGEDERNSPVQHGASASTRRNKATGRAHKTPQRP